MAITDDGNVTTFLTPPSADSTLARWSPDGTKIAFVERTVEHFSGRIEVIGFDEHSGTPLAAARSLYTAPVDRGGGWSIHDLSWSPDGLQIATVLQNSGWDHIYLVALEGSHVGGAPKQLTDGAFTDAQSQFSPDGNRLAFVSSRGSLLEASNPWIMPAEGGEAHQAAIFAAPGIAYEPQWSSDSARLYFHRQSPRETADLFVTAADGAAQAQQLTATTPANLATAVVPERVSWKSKDGREIAGMLYMPPGDHAKDALPLVEWVHGGPEGQDNFGGDEWAQYLAGAGYVVLEPNYRGSNGYGEAFRNLNVEDSGGAEVDDVASGAKYLIGRGLVDPKRMAIGGISHGATMAIYMIVRYPDFYAAAIEFAGVADRALFNERTNPASVIR